MPRNRAYALSADPIDLTTLELVRAYAGVESKTEDDIIQQCITAFSMYVLSRTCRDSLNSIKDYTEVYDGNGSFRLFLRNRPITEIVSIQVGARTLQPSVAFGQPGYFIDQSGKSVAVRQGGSAGTYSGNVLGSNPYWFAKGVGNVQVVYKAGYNGTPLDLEMACRAAVSVNYKRRAWQDLASKSLSAAGATGTTRYRDWEMTPDQDRVLLSYQRFSM